MLSPARAKGPLGQCRVVALRQNGRTSLHILVAASAQNPDEECTLAVVEALVAAGANLEARDRVRVPLAFPVVVVIRVRSLPAAQLIK